MAIEDIQLDVGGTKFKGVWIAIVLSFASTIGGGIWTASEFFSRLESLENNVSAAKSTSDTTNARFDDLRESWAEDKRTIISDLEVAKQQIQDANIDELQGKLATLGTNLQTIMEQQRQLLEIQERIVEVEKQITETKTLVQKAELMMKDADEINGKLDRITREIDDLWEGMDYLSNPYGTTGIE